MPIREREPRFKLFGFPIGSKIGKKIEIVSENEDNLKGFWRGYYRGYYVKAIGSDTLAKGMIVNVIDKKGNKPVFLPARQILHRDEINQDPITRKIVYWEP